MSKIRVFLVDDHPIVRRGLSLLLSLESDITVCGEAGTAPLALTKILSLRPDVTIVDLQLQGGSGLELIKQLRSQALKLKILVCTMQSGHLYIERALRAGADGYITKEEGPEVAVQAVRSVMAGSRYLSSDMAKRFVDGLTGKAHTNTPSVDNLTDREIEVLQLLGRGLGSREIAGQLHVSIKTVESHRENIKNKLRLSGATELIRYAFSWVHGLEPATAPRTP